MDEWTTQLAPQLRALAELAAQDGHMTGAAAALGIPQSSMSRRIHALEQMLRVPLLIRHGRTVRLTPTALDLARQSSAPLRELDQLLDQLVGDADPERGTVRFGFPLTLGSGAVPDTLADFNLAHPGIHLHLKQAHGSALVADLQSGVVDLAIMIPPPTELPHTVIATQKIHVVLPANHPLADRTSIPLSELRNERFIANPLSYNLRQVTEEWCAAEGFKPNVALEITEFATMRELIRRGLGIALLPPVDRPTRGTVELQTAGNPLTRDISLARADSTQSGAVMQLAHFILERHFGS